MYNLILDSKFNNNWKLRNCSLLEEDVFLSSSNLFMLSQKIVIDKKSKVYFRFNFQALSEMKSVKAGIKINDTLYISNKYPKLNDERYVSLVEEVEGLIEVFIICESFDNTCLIKIRNPFLLNLNEQGLENKLIEQLDKIKFKGGSEYINLLNLEPNYGKDTYYGSYIEVTDKFEEVLECELELDKHYVFKMRIEELNQFGDIYLTYGTVRSKRNNNDLILPFKSNGKHSLKVVMIKHDNIDYSYNVLLKQQLLAQIDNLDWDFIKLIEFAG